jgi:PKD repeat protein
VNLIISKITKLSFSEFSGGENSKQFITKFLYGKRAFIVLGITLLMLIFSQIAVAGSSWDCDCLHRKEIILDNSTGSALTNYQIRIDVTHETAMNADYSNIKFTASDGSSVIHHWIETYDGTRAVVWVKVPSIAASATTTIYLYYGGSSCSSSSNASDVFLFFDDFSTFAGWTTYGKGDVAQNTTAFSYNVGEKKTNCDPNGGFKLLGTTIDNFRLITREQRPTSSPNSCALNRYGVENSDFDGYNINRYATSSGNAEFGYERRDNGDGGNQNQINLPQPEGTWFRTELRRCQSTDLNEALLYNDSRTEIGSVSGSISGYNYSNFDRVTIRGGHDYYIDFMAVAEYTCNEPTVYVGTEQDGVIADFSASTTSIYVGDSIDFTDHSIGNPTSRSWSFSGGTPATSTTQDPVITYNTAGTYNVSLTVSNGSCSSTETKTNYITVSDLPSSACSFSNNTSTSITITPCIDMPLNPQEIPGFHLKEYFILNVISGIKYEVYSCNESSFFPTYENKITVYNEASGTLVAFSENNSNSNHCDTNSKYAYVSFVPGFSGQVRVLLNDRNDCYEDGSTMILGRITYSMYVNVVSGSNSLDDKTNAGTDSWIGHIYDGTNASITSDGDFNQYLGYYTEPEIFDQEFDGDETCFSPVNSDGNIRAEVYTQTYAVRYQMNSSKKGLYIVDIGSDDGSRLDVDGTLVYSDWGPQSYTTNSRILFNLTGASNLQLDYYEDAGANRISFQNLNLILENKLSSNLNQTICVGTSGSAISGDTYGSLPSGISQM